MNPDCCTVGMHQLCVSDNLMLAGHLTCAP
jgi:hypothetical protein